MDKLEILREQVSGCEKCELHRQRNNIVFGDGNPEAEIMLISEGPGYHEDMQGKTFVGKSGQLLDKILGSLRVSARQAPFYCQHCKVQATKQPRSPATGAGSLCSLLIPTN